MDWSHLQLLYAFESPEVFILEVKRLGMPENAAKDERFFWFIFDRQQHTLRRLQFRSLAVKGEQQHREFDLGKMWFDPQHGRLELSTGQVFSLTHVSADQLPSEVKNSIVVFFDSASA